MDKFGHILWVWTKSIELTKCRKITIFTSSLLKTNLYTQPVCSVQNKFYKHPDCIGRVSSFKISGESYS